MSNSYRIELASRTDVPEIVALYLQGFEQSAYNTLSVRPESIETNFYHLIDNLDLGHYFLVAKQEEVVIGFMLFAHYPNGTHLLPGVPLVKEHAWFVAPAFRSKSLADDMLSTLESYASRLKAEHVLVGFMPASIDTSSKAFDRYLKTKGYVLSEQQYNKEVF